MENLPDAMVSEILRRLDRTADRNAFSMVSSRLCSIEADQRRFLRVGCGLHPATEGLTSLCIRFSNLTRLEIVYSGWMSSMGKQVDNQGLLVLSKHCAKLADLTLSFCAFVDDAGLGHLVHCKSLQALKLNFVPGISSNGLLSVASGCKNLSGLHLSRCMKVNSVEWLEYLGKHGNLDSLSIKNCRGLGQDDLIMFGPGWRKLRRLEFELDTVYRYGKVFGEWTVSKWMELSCDNLKELVLVNCSLDPGRLLSYVLGRCGALKNLSLDMCSRLEDKNMLELSRKSSNLRRISLCLSAGYVASVDGPSRLTDDGLKELARGCSMLEEFELSLPDWEFLSVSCFTQDGILNLIQSCPIRVLALNNAGFFNDVGMGTLRSAHFLQVLELVKCQDVTDEGIRHIVNFPSLNSLKLSKCLGVTDAGLKPLVLSGKLDSLMVEDCLLISENGIRGAARHVSYRQDLSWMY